MNHVFSQKTTALIITYNRLEKLKLCLATTQALAFDSIVIINNASSDGTKTWLDSLSDTRLNIVHMNNNTGGAGGFKFGLQYIANHMETDWVFCFDDDAYPDSDLLNHFIQLNKQDYQIFASNVITTAGHPCSMNIPYKKIPHTILETCLYKLQTPIYSLNHQDPCDVESFSFVGCILHRDLIRQHAHAIHDPFFIYYDDLAFAFYLNQLGYKIRYNPDFIFTHDIDLKSTIYSGKKLYYLIRNLIIIRKIFKKKPLFTIPVILCRILFISLTCLSKKRQKQNLKHIIQGIKDGISYRPVKSSISS